MRQSELNSTISSATYLTKGERWREKRDRLLCWRARAPRHAVLYV